MILRALVYTFIVLILLTLLSACGGGSSDTSPVDGGPDTSVVDSDGDGVNDSDDVFPEDPSEWSDNDADGTGDNADTDDDNDGMSDAFENQYGLDPLVNDAAEDRDSDGFTNLQESEYGTDPTDPLSFPASVTVNLGTDFSIYNDETLTLNSNASGAGSINYQWTQIAGNSVTLTTPTAASTHVEYTKATETETYQFELTASNAFSSSSDTITVTVVDRIDEAVRTGNPEFLPSNVVELEQRIQQNLLAEQNNTVLLHQAIFGSTAINYDPTRNSRLFDLISLTSAMPLISGSANGKILATASNSETQRTVAFGHNVLVALNNGELSNFAVQMKSTLDWLLAPHSLSSTDTITVATMLMSSSHMNQTANWLSAQFPNINIIQCNEEAQLSSCIEAAHLIITGSANSMSDASVTAALDQAFVNGQSLLYTHNGSWNSYDLTNPVLKYFGVQTETPGEAGNYFVQDRASWSSASEMHDTTDVLKKLVSLVQRFEKDTFSFSIAQCDDNNSNCSNVAAFADEFLDSAEILRALIKNFDESLLDIFSHSNQYPLEKLLVLLGDQYRQSVNFPMSKATSNTQSFLRSYFADHLVYHQRQFNPVQSDLGNFSRTDFSAVTPINKTISLTSRKSFRAAGVYALPGQTVTVKRTDTNTAVTASVFVNTLRSSSTQHMDPNNGYNRPKFLQSNKMPLAAGETIRFTSPYGGPIQIGFIDKGTSMMFEFSNVGQHAFWRTGDNDSNFLSQLAAGQYDWVEIASKYFEIHSTASKIESTLNDNRWDTPSKIETFLTKYHHNYFRVEAGYQGEDIEVVNEIHDFANTNNLSIATWEQVHHMNADQPSCGYGCSGNPYDAGWSFEVLGHGDLHETGHTVEDSRFKFNGFEGHSTTNFYSYYAKSRGQNEDAIVASCQSLKFSDYYNHLQSGDNMSNLNYTGWNYSAALMVEILMHAEERGALSNGWHLIPRLHIIGREFNQNDDTDTEWNAIRSNLGFSSYTRSEARSADNNDWLLIAISFATGLDYRPFFDMIGQSYSTKANDQVNSFGYPAVERAFYLPANNSDYCNSLTGHTKQVF